MGRPLPNDLKVAVDILAAELKVRLKGDKVLSEKLLWDDEAAAFDLPPHAIVFQLELSSGRRCWPASSPGDSLRNSGILTREMKFPTASKRL